MNQRPRVPAAVTSEYLPLKALAVYAGLSVRTLRMYLAHPAYPLPCFRIGGKVLVRRSEFDAWAASFRSTVAAPVAIDALVDQVMAGLQ